jgi:hypothetical protein
MEALGFEPYLDATKQGPIISSYKYPDHPKWNFGEFYERLNAKGFVIYPGKVGDQGRRHFPLPYFLPSFLLTSLPSFLPSFPPSYLSSYLSFPLSCFLPSPLPSFLPSFLPPALPSFLPPSCPSFLPSFLPPVLPWKGRRERG